MAQDAKVTTVPTLMAQDAKVTTIPASRSPAAERMRQHRERRRQGLRCLLIEISETEIEGLIRKGLLPAEMRNDVGAVMWHFMSTSTAHWPAPVTRNVPRDQQTPIGRYQIRPCA